MADKSTMVPGASWRDHFKIDDKIFKAFWDEFSQSSPLRASELNIATADQTVEFVLWCVREGHFTENEFTRFQSEQFNLPVIRSEFFEAPVDHDFWMRVKDLHPWSTHCLPLTEWDGHILVGSVFPSETFKTSLRHRIVLATPTQLREFYTRMQTKGAHKVSKPKVPPTAVVKTESVAPISAASEKPVDNGGDPFAALSRQLGMTDDEATPNSVTENENTDASNASDEIVMPEGLSFNKDEISRLTASGNEPFIAVQETSAKGSSADDLVSAIAALKSKADAPKVSNEASSNESASAEPGTVVHNFETGKGEVVSKLEGAFSIKADKTPPPAPPKLKAPILQSSVLEAPTEDAALALEDTQPSVVKKPEMKSTVRPTLQPPIQPPIKPPMPSASPSKTPSTSIAPAAKPSTPPTATSSVASMAPPAPPPAPSSKLKAPAPPKPSVPFAPTAMPFAPSVTPGKPAVAAEPKPATPPPPVVEETPLELEKDGPARPVAEATVVVKAENTVVMKNEPKTARKPLFEPTSSPKTAGGTQGAATTTQPGMGSNTAGPAANTQTGTRTRKLESTPVTSFFGMGGAAAASGGPRTNPRGGRSPDVYMARSVAVSKLDPIHLDQCRSVDEAGAQALLQACNIFETAMILLFKDGELLPWKWNDLFLSVKGDKPDTIDLAEPSIFKVVFRTAKPYHGYVVTSTVNQKFFNEFYRGVLPKHATVIPIMIDGRMGGMMLGFTNSKIDYRQSLRLMERLAFDMSRVFKSLRGTMSKAG